MYFACATAAALFDEGTNFDLKTTLGSDVEFSLRGLLTITGSSKREEISDMLSLTVVVTYYVFYVIANSYVSSVFDSPCAY